MLRMIATTTITNQEILSVKMHVNANKPHSTGVAYNTVQKRRESAALFLRLGYMMIITMVNALSLSLSFKPYPNGLTLALSNTHWLDPSS